MSDIEVSVITPTFNRADLLPRVWQSLKDQKAYFEWIVVDDGSTDNTEHVVKNFRDRRITYVALSKNCGVNVARNRGVSLAHGRYIVFLDSDDELCPASLDYMIALMDAARPDIGAAVFPCIVYETGKQISELPDGQVLNEFDVVCRDALYAGGEKLLVYRKGIFAEFMLPEDLRGCESVFVFGISRKWQFLLSNKPLRVIHRQEDNLSNADSLIARSYDIARSYERLISNHAEILGNNRAALFGYLKKALYRYCVAGHPTEAWRVYKKLLTKSESIAEITLATGMLALSFSGAFQFEKWRIDRLNRKLLGRNK